MTEGSQRHLVLIGLMGAGKSTVGEACAARLDRPFVDTDQVVEAIAGQTVAEIFRVDGEATFRALEHQAVADACAAPEPLVIACGGGAVLDPENRQQMRAHGVVVWLRADPAVLTERVSPNLGDRPLLRDGAAEQELRRLAELRGAAYEGTAHAVVDTDERSVDDVVDAVLEELQRCPS